MSVKQLSCGELRRAVWASALLGAARMRDQIAPGAELRRAPHIRPGDGLAQVDVLALADVVYSPKDIGAAMASGSFPRWA